MRTSRIVSLDQQTVVVVALLKKGGTGRCVPNTRTSQSIIKWNRRLRRSTVFILAVEQLTNSITSAWCSRVQRVLVGAWESAQQVYMCFVDLDYSVPDALLQGVRSLCNQFQLLSLVCVARCKSDLFLLRLGLCQDCPFTLILFIAFMDRISWCSQGIEGCPFW